MEVLDYKQIFDAIKNDDLKTFSSLLPSEKLNISFGRFPLLSVLYLFESCKILKTVEKRIIRTSKFEEAPEFFDIYLRFKQRAKKCLRLYTVYDKIIYPIEMLAVLDERHHLNKYYKVLFKNEEIVKRLTKIYKINHKTDGEITQEKLKLPKKPFGFKQKFLMVIVSVVVALMCSFSGVMIGVVSNKSGLGTKLSPIGVSTEQELLTALENGYRVYELENDITISKPLTAYNFSGVLDGNGHTIFVGENLKTSLVRNLSGKITDLHIDALVDEKKFDESFAFFAQTSTGTISGCKLTANIKAQSLSEEDIWISGFVIKNKGTISNCVSNLDADMENLRDRNCYLSAFVGVNDGTIKNSKTETGSFSSDTVDLAGFANENNGLIKASINNISMTQTSDEQWHPNTSGFVNTNNGTIDSCKNYGDIYSESTLSVPASYDAVYYVFASGFACENFGLISKSTNYANIVGVGTISNVYSAGIVSMNHTYNNISAVVEKSYSLQDKEISAKSEDVGAYAAGIAAYNTASVENCGFEGMLWADSKGDAVAAGVVAYNYASRVSDSFAIVKILNEKVVNKTGNFFAGVVGISIDNIEHVYNNFYVTDSSFTSAAYFYNSIFKVWRELTDAEISTTAYLSAADLKSEVKIYD